MELIGSYLDNILQVNQNINIVSRETTRDGLIKIAADCLIPYEIMAAPTGKFFDIGAGAGFPSIVLLLVFDRLSGVLFERTRKKALFLESIVRKYDLRGTVMAEDFLAGVRSLREGSFNSGFMKYVKLEGQILKAALSLIAPGGHFIYYSNMNAGSPVIPSGISRRTYNYYLDDKEPLRSLTIFSK